LDEVPITQLIVLSASLVLAACFSAAEALISRLSKEEILEKVEEGGWGADIITSLLQEPRKYSATIIVAKSCLVVTIVFLVFSIGNLFGYHQIVAPIISTILIVIFIEIVPKNYIKGRNRNSLVYAAKFLQISYIILYFIVKPTTVFSYIWLRIFGGKVNVEEETLASPEEIEALVNVGDSEEILEKEERDMIYRILDLPDTVAREVMIPRTDMVCLDISASMDEILETVILSRHSRVPVYEDTIDNIIGILHVKYMFEFWRTKQPINLQEIIANRPPFLTPENKINKDLLQELRANQQWLAVRPPFFTPESKKIKDLLQELRANKQRMAIVVDEYGGTAGLLTTEDIIEEIVGEIQDEDETGEFEIQYVVDAKADISKLNELLDTNLPFENTNSVENFIVNFLGKNPEVGETFEYQNLHFSILESNESEILSVGIVKRWDGNVDATATDEIQYELKKDDKWFQLRYLVDAKMDIHELNELLGTNLTSESVDTIGGLIIDMLGEVPEKDRSFEYQGLQFFILEADERRILRLAVVRKEELIRPSEEGK